MLLLAIIFSWDEREAEHGGKQLRYILFNNTQATLYRVLYILRLQNNIRIHHISVPLHVPRTTCSHCHSPIIYTLLTRDRRCRILPIQEERSGLRDSRD